MCLLVPSPHAKEFDNTVLRTASEKLGLPPSLDNVALLPLSLPIRLGGFGFRSVRLASPAAYWASFARSVPYILEFVPESERLIRGELKANFIEDVNSCHRALCTIIQNVPKELIPPDPNTIWTTYGKEPFREDCRRRCAPSLTIASLLTITRPVIVELTAANDQLLSEECRGVAYGSPANPCGHPLRQ